ncbi:sigma-70 family RNA polymerase sigma factor [Brevundimonas sp. 2R-24]|uniref:RNA polymerase sigma factor n=1 Tax=Peiella sedimenti TaxID=3061083 RepID=A0ABT8SJR9_9CAUL|nr:sigma-70 family RNA polymerase sigma factor [Caulobacteraceae bacterium XZ-24]
MFVSEGAPERLSTERPETVLLRRIALRDRAAFAELFSLVAPKVKAYLIRLGTEAAGAEELTQDVLLTVWRKADQFDPAKAGPLTWIFVIARNRRIDALRRERSTVTYGFEPPEQADEDTPSAEAQLSGTEREIRVREALKLLPPDQQEVVRRSFFDEQPHSEIAEALNLPLGTVKSRLRLAFAKLRDRLEDL